MRSDFLDRAAEDRRFVEELARGLVFLQPLHRAGLEVALAQPLQMLGYAFEPGIVASMLDTLDATPGPLPLLQFTAAKLWETRDRSRRLLTQRSYRAIGGVAGALATYADEVISWLRACGPEAGACDAVCAWSRRSARARLSIPASCASSVATSIGSSGLLVASRLRRGPAGRPRSWSSSTSR